MIDVWPDGRLTWNSRTVRCALGPAGVVADKVEGDGATPAGVFPLRYVFYRPDRVDPPAGSLETRALRKADGWCDDPDDPAYNRLVELPYPASAETLWRDDDVYDLIVVLGHNDDPPVPGAGSAVFFHLAKPDFAPTEGCVAIERDILIEILSNIDKDAQMRINL